MDNIGYSDKFLITGLVDDYLEYKNYTEKDELNDNDINFMNFL